MGTRRDFGHFGSIASNIRTTGVVQHGTACNLAAATAAHHRIPNVIAHAAFNPWSEVCTVV